MDTELEEEVGSLGRGEGTMRGEKEEEEDGMGRGQWVLRMRIEKRIERNIEGGGGGGSREWKGTRGRIRSTKESV